MGTYTKLVLANKSDEFIKELNQTLHDLGIYKQEIYNGVAYGAFITKEQLEEDARYLNEDSEGLEQLKHVERPITVEWLGSLFWNTVGELNCKLSGGTEDKILESVAGVAKYCKEHKLLYTKKCDNYQPGFIKSYMIRKAS